MNNQNIFVYQFKPFFQILKELENELNFNVIEILNEKILNEKIENSKNYIIISNKININYSNYIVLDKLPVKIFKIIEKLNIELLKKQFNNQSKIYIKQYVINLNSREISSKEKKMKLTEKEVKIIIYLSKSAKAINTKELQNNVWGYQSNLETHTVETHIYRLRKKFLDFFEDNEFIKSEKNGYKIK